MKLIKLMNNLHTVKFGRMRVWFSYETPIAYMIDGRSAIISENVWGNTTGKHISQIKALHEHQQIPAWEFSNHIRLLVEEGML